MHGESESGILFTVMRFFNTTGPCFPERHYMLPPEERLVGAQLHRYVRDQLYWTLHAPRQTGKTTFLMSWARELNASRNFAACCVSVERCQGIAEAARAMPEIKEAVFKWARYFGFPEPTPRAESPSSLLSSVMETFAQMVAPKPLVVFFDEVDVLEGETLISFLRQLRDGFAGRGVGAFPVSIVLTGMRDLKGYITQAKDGVRVNPGSPFNIKEDSASIDNFSKDNIVHLFAQRTEETGQQIAPEALEYVWKQSHGQPWIVNNLFKRATMRVLDENDFATVQLAHVQAARDQMVEARETHLDALEYRLDDPAIRRVIATFINGEPDASLLDTEGFRLAQDLGLVARINNAWTVANPIYREVLARKLTYAAQETIYGEFRWQAPDGSLDMDSLLLEFQKFWRRNSEIWEQKSDYTEVFPQLLLMAFLQRLLNGGGHIDREYALGRGRLDLLVEYRGAEFLLELKIMRDYDSPAVLLEESLEQTRRYRDGIDATIPAYLLIFDRRSDGKKAPWDERLTWCEIDGITVVGL